MKKPVVNRLSLAVCCWFLFVSQVSFSQLRGTPLFRHYSHAQYEAHPSTWCMLEGSNGHLYFGNRSVVLEYDGVFWNKIPVQPNAPVYSMDIDSIGRIFVGTLGDFGVLEQDSVKGLVFKSFSPLLPPNAPKFHEVWKVHYWNDAVYFQTNKAIFKWKNGKIKVIKPADRFHFSFKINDRFYIKDTAYGLMTLVNDSLLLVDSVFKGNDRKSHIYGIQPFGQDSLLIMTRGNGFFTLNVASETPKNTFKAAPFITANENWIRSVSVYGLEYLRNGVYAIASLEDGVRWMDSKGNFLEHINTTQELSTNHIRSVTRDRCGGMWLCSNDGIFRVANDLPFLHWGKPQRVYGSPFQMIRFDDILYVTTSDGVFYLSDGRFSPVDGLRSHAWDFEIWKDQNGDRQELLVATDEGIYTIRGNKSRLVSDFKSTVITQHPSQSEVMLVSGQTGLHVFTYDFEEFNYLNSSHQIDDKVIDIQFDQHEKVWVGTASAGLFTGTIELDKLNQHTPLKHLAAAEGLINIEETRMFWDNQMLVLSGHKVYKYDEKTGHFNLLRLHLDNQDESLGTIFFHRDAQGNYWLQRNNSSYEVWLEKWEKLENGQMKQETSPYAMLPRTLIRQVYTHPNGDTWIVSSDGLFQVPATFEYTPEQNHRAIITKVDFTHQTSNYHLPGSNQLVLKSKEKEVVIASGRNVVFSFSSNSFRNESHNQFRYKLQGYDLEWSSWSENTTIRYTNLSAGQYNFIVETKNFDGIIGEQAVHKFQIPVPWYATIWAYSFYVMALLACFLLVAALYTRRVKRQNILLEKKILERTHTISQQKDKINLQVEEIMEQNTTLNELNKEKNFLLGTLAHDLKNPLNSMYSITQLIKMDEQEFNGIDKEYIDKIEQISYALGQRVTEILDIASLDAASFKVNMKKANLTLLIQHTLSEMSPLAERKKISLDFSGANVVHFAFIDTRLLKKAIENLVDNAIKFSSAGSCVKVSITDSNDKNRITITDDGPGLTSEDKIGLFQRFTTLSAKPTNGESSTGLGLSIVKKIVDAMGGKVCYEHNKPKGSIFIIEI